jgi:hypothetical protein
MKKLTLLVCLIVVPLLAFGCANWHKVDHVSIGGFIAAKDCEAPNQKATFGGIVQCIYEDGNFRPCLKGQFEYFDHVATMECVGDSGQIIPVHFHGVFDGYSCTNSLKSDTYYAEGIYTVQPPLFDCDGNKITGKFKIKVEDNGTPQNCGKEDFLKVEICSGPLAGYCNYGKLQGGNIEIVYVDGLPD